MGSRQHPMVTAILDGTAKPPPCLNESKAGTREETVDAVQPVDETVDANGEWYPRGRCDTCGSPCDAETGDCTGTAWHVTAIA